MTKASFFRTLPVDHDLRQDGADCRGLYAFQMVPVGSTRPGQISVSGGIATIKSADASIVKIAQGANMAPADEIKINNTPSGSFILLGQQRSGSTFIGALDENGNPLHRLFVSVKEEVKVRYNLLRLKDGLHRDASMKLAGAESILLNVEQLYLSQTNVRLIKQKVAELDISDRILSDKNRVLQLDELFDNKDTIIFNEIMAKGFGNADVVFVFTWHIEGGNLPLSTTGLALNGKTKVAAWHFRTGPSIIYLNTFAPGGVARLNFAAAHELGHHFGMSHYVSRPPNYLMNADAGGFRMIDNDIHLANRTGI